MVNVDLRVPGSRRPRSAPGRGPRRLSARAGLLFPLPPQPPPRRLSALAGLLFPLPPQPPPRRLSALATSAAVQAAAVGIGAVVLLLRVAGVPAWDSVYEEDNGVFLVQAMQHPWHLLVPYNGYLQVVPRLIGQFAAMVPLSQVPRVYAVGGALIGAGCALFAYHASAGHIRSRWLRALLAATVVLLPVAPLEIADSGVNCVWYLGVALLWAIVWRPRSRAGRALAALTAFATVASNLLMVVLLPLLLLRAIALRGAREHAVTLGFAAGCLLQLPLTLRAAALGQRRVSHLSKPASVLGYYAHSVVLRVPGWRLSWDLTRLAGVRGATFAVGLALGAVFALIIAQSLASRDWRVLAFTAMALLTGFAEDYVGSSIDTYTIRWKTTLGFESAARYSTLPILLLEAAVIVAADAAVRRRAAARQPAPEAARGAALVTAAVAALACGLVVGWVTDYRYLAVRSQPSWAPTAARWIHECQGGRTSITIPAWEHATAVVSCRNVHS